MYYYLKKKHKAIFEWADYHVHPAWDNHLVNPPTHNDGFNPIMFEHPIWIYLTYLSCLGLQYVFRCFTNNTQQPQQ